MPTARKEELVVELRELIERSTAVIVTDYRGLSVSAITDLRSQLRGANSEYHIAKNTLASRAAQSAGVEGLDPALSGPTALAFAFGDPAAPAKVLNEFARTSRILTIRAGLLNNKLISAEDVSTLATLEPREVLLAKVLGGFNAPIASFVGVLSASISSIAYVLQARIEQLGTTPDDSLGEAAPAVS
ncbi:MAG: 50S ribosomal protein L10 [Chloroflexia bacterium]|jgi:large subunit ribosomal protein L10|nr:50S ribosomal protein L10 [Chloroflexia bacterium]